MKIQRGELAEKSGIFQCLVSVSATDIAAFLRFMPSAGVWISADVSVEAQATRPALPPPPAPVEDPKAGQGRAVVDPRPGALQVIAPAGFDISKLGLSHGVPKELIPYLLLCRDPLFQEWCIEQTKVTQGDVHDAVEFAAKQMALAAGVPAIIEAKPEHLPALVAFGERYGVWLDARRIAAAATPG